MKEKKSSLFGSILIGIIFIIVGMILLWWNEGNNVKNIKTVSEISENVIEVNSSIINPENDGRLILTNGDLVVEDESVYDDVFAVGLKTTNLKRIVEVYQWEEEETTDSNNNTTYKYNKEWNEGLINSNSFNNPEYKNPINVQYESADFTALNVKVGEYNLSNEQIENLPTDIELDLFDVVAIEGYKVVGNYITNANDYSNPQIGDIRISWQYNDWNEATVLAVQNGNTFTNYTSTVGKTINEVTEGILSSDEMINKMQDNNDMLKWGLRGTGALLIILGYAALISPLTRLASFIPFLGGFVGGTISFIAFLTGVANSLMIIAIAWIRFRPVLGISLLLICLLLIFIVVRLIAKNKKK